MSTQPRLAHGVARFGVYQVDFRAGELHKSGIKVKLTDQPFRLLAVLLERRGQLVTRQELREQLWPNYEYGEFDDGLNTAINRLRATLDDSAENPRFIETVPRHGYRFIAPIEFEAEAPALPPASAPSLPASVAAAAHLTASSFPATSLAPRAFARLAGGVAMILILGVGGAAVFVWRRSRERTTSAAEAPIRSIAVLPFENFSGDASQDFLAEGMTDELTTELAQVGSLRVTSRSSVLALGRRREPMRQIRDELGVDAVVEGSVAREGQSVRVDAHLVDTADDRQIWAQSFTENEQNILALEDDVARTIAERIEVAIDPDVRQRLNTSRPVIADAYEAYLHGTSFMADHTDADLMKSLDYFKQAVSIDPTLADAYAAEAQAYCYLGDYGVLPDRVVWPQAEIAAEHAIALDDTIGKAHAARAFALWRYEWNWETADKEFKRALFLTPNDSDTHHLYGIFLATKGDFADAQQQLTIARELDPLSLIVRTNIGWLRYYQRDYSSAIADYQKVLRADPKFIPAQNKLWIAYALAGDSQDAGIELDTLYRSYGHPGLAERGAATQGSGNLKSRFRTKVLAYANSGYLTAYEEARYFAVAGERQKAMDSLEIAMRKRDSWMVYAGIEPAFDPLRLSQKFQNLLAAIGLSNARQKN
ncbi:MAG: winged helix-turn-helix domain-containing tetratricopeptide repeat protein [Candidatus Acidiferrales bacterium]